MNTATVTANTATAAATLVANCKGMGFDEAYQLTLDWSSVSWDSPTQALVEGFVTTRRGNSHPVMAFFEKAFHGDGFMFKGMKNAQVGNAEWFSALSRNAQLRAVALPAHCAPPAEMVRAFEREAELAALRAEARREKEQLQLDRQVFSLSKAEAYGHRVALKGPMLRIRDLLKASGLPVERFTAAWCSLNAMQRKEFLALVRKGRETRAAALGRDLWSV